MMWQLPDILAADYCNFQCSTSAFTVYFAPKLSIGYNINKFLDSRCSVELVDCNVPLCGIRLLERRSLCACDLLWHVKIVEMQIVGKQWHEPSAALSDHVPDSIQYLNSASIHSNASSLNKLLM
jgi:hypothetical protein